jgi:hypothetical protein
MMPAEFMVAQLLELQSAAGPRGAASEPSGVAPVATDGPVHSTGAVGSGSYSESAGLSPALGRTASQGQGLAQTAAGDTG